MKKREYILIFLAAVLGLLIVVALRRRSSFRYGGRGGFMEESPELEPHYFNCEKELREGIRGEEVRVLQEWINRKVSPRDKIKEDGIFGPQTASSLRQVSVEVLGYPIRSTSLIEIPELREHCA